jgi:acetyl esterase/lipase
MALTMSKIAPKGKSNGKAIISLVSGNWVSSYAMLARYSQGSEIYAENGYTVFMVMHSSQPRYSIVDEAADIKRAVRYVRYHSRKFGVDSLHIGITGSSSGGHLSLLTALANETIIKGSKDPVDAVSSRVQAAAVFFPPTDFLNWGKANTEMQKQGLRLFGVIGAFDFKAFADSTGLYERINQEDKINAIAKSLSPINLVTPDDPPVFITHGDKDNVVPLQQSEIIIKKLNEAKVINKFVLKPGGAHGWNDSDVEKKMFIEWFNKYL